MWMRSYRKNKYFYPHPRKMKIQLKILSGGTFQDLRLDFFTKKLLLIYSSGYLAPISQHLSAES